MTGKYSIKLKMAPTAAAGYLLTFLLVLGVDALLMWWAWTVLVEHFGIPALGYWDMFKINLGVVAAWPTVWIAYILNRKLHLTLEKRDEDTSRDHQ
jgi:hypothetical protein